MFLVLGMDAQARNKPGSLKAGSKLLNERMNLNPDNLSSTGLELNPNLSA